MMKCCLGVAGHFFHYNLLDTLLSVWIGQKIWTVDLLVVYALKKNVDPFLHKNWKFSAHKTFVKLKFQKMYSVSSKNYHLKVHVHFIVSAKVSIVSDIIFPAHDHWLTVSFPVICRSQVLPWAVKEKRNWRRRRRRQMMTMICLDLQGQWSSIRDGGDRNEEQKLAFEKFKRWNVDFFFPWCCDDFNAMTEYSYHLITLLAKKGP